MKTLYANLQSMIFLLMFILLMGFFKVDVLANGNIYIKTTSIPKINEGSYVEGYIWTKNETKINYEDYNITMYLEVKKNGKVWGPKPTYANPKVEIDKNNKFSCLFNTGGYDIEAERLYILLIPSSFEPNADFERTKKIALNIVTIDRNSNGQIISDEKIDGTISNNPVNNFSSKIKSSLKTPKLSISYSPYTNNTSPERNDSVSLEHMLWQLNVMYPYIDTIKIFGVTGELTKIYKPAKEDYNLRIIGGCWIDKRYSEDKIYNELDALVDLANKGYIDIVCVGSETIFRNDFSVSKLIEYIDYVKSKINDKTIPVSTSDTAQSFLDNPKLADACDMILFTYYPFFEKSNIDIATKNLKSKYEQIKLVSKNKNIIITETGWPTNGSNEGKAVPSMENAKKYFEESYEWSRNENIEIVYFSGMDESWKIEGVNKDIGSNWGHFYNSGFLKEAYKELYDKIATISEKY